MVNRYRYLTAQPQEALTLLYEVQQAARLQPTGIVNNSNLGSETTAELILEAVPYAKTIAEAAGLPLICTTYREDLPVQVENGFPVQVYVKPVWEQDAAF